MKPWIDVVGFGEDGVDGLSPAARVLVETAEVLVGGARHLAKVAGSEAERIDWGEGFDEALDRLAERKGRRITVLASGDPFDYGVAKTLARRFGAEAMTVVPIPGSLSLACARLGWSRPDVETLTVHGRPLETIVGHLAPGLRLLMLSRDGETPARVARLLCEHGYGPSPMTVLEHLGGEDERRLDGVAEDWPHPRAADLNVLAVECRPGPGVRILSRGPGLPDDAFEHDGQLTKREVRAATLARLMPLPGQVLWDLGAGSGAVAIEWMRAERSALAVAVERRAQRCAVIARNALRLGVPRLEVVEGEVPGILATLAPPPDAIFAGGGISRDGMLEACWNALPAGGRLVANAVTVEAERRLFDVHHRYGGDMTRLAISRLAPLGALEGFKPLMTVTQYAVVKE